MADQYEILGGPSKWDLSVALFDKGRKVTFSAACPETIEFEMCVQSVQAEDGSRESWNIEGSAIPDDFQGHTTELNHLHPDIPAYQLKQHRVFIYYRTNTRKGYIRFLS